MLSNSLEGPLAPGWFREATNLCPGLIYLSLVPRPRGALCPYRELLGGGVQLCTHQPALLPLAQVTMHQEFPWEEVPVDGPDISSEVKEGFTIHRPRASLLFSIGPAEEQETSLYQVHADRHQLRMGLGL